MTLFSSYELARRIERADAAIKAAYAEALRSLVPESDAAHHAIAGGELIYAGPGSPVSRAVGLGFEPITNDTLRELEAWFQQRQCPLRIDVCPLVSADFMQLVASGRYPLQSFKNTWALTLRDLSLEAPEASVDVREIQAHERELWAQTVGRGFAAREEVSGADVEIARPTSFSRVVSCFLGFVGAEAAGGGAVAISDGIALLSSMSTRAAFRRRGVQRALLSARLRFARAQGCELAIVHTTPTNTDSQRNVERLGFTLLYTKITLGA